MNTCIPVVHLGQIEAVTSLTGAIPGHWAVVYLWCPRDIAEKRIIDRNTGDVEDRLRAWDETKALQCADVSINTGLVKPKEAARLIDARVPTLDT
jgi:guanylate kinase